MIIKIEKSPHKHKRYRITMDNNKKYDFGLDTGYTYIDGETNENRNNYLKRHLGNDIEKRLIENLIPSPSLFAYYILWGKSRNIKKNIDYLNMLFSKKYGKN